VQAVILAGGKGTRLGNMEIPKAMVKVGGTPVLEHQINLLRKYGVKDLVLCVKHLSGQIKSYFGNGSKFGVRITYSEERNFLGTAGAVKFAGKFIKGDFVLLYGDVMLNVDIGKLMRYHKAKKGMATLVVRKSDHPADSDLIEMDSRGRIKRILGKPKSGQKFRNITNAAIYVLGKKSLESVPAKKPADFGRDIFPAMIQKGLPLYGYFTDEYVKDMGTPERLEKVRKDFMAGRILKRKAVFIDRDGVLNEEVDIVYKPSQLKLIRGSAEAVKMLRESGYLVIAVTNQPVVARGMVTEDDIAVIHARLSGMLAKKGSKLDAIYYCPHHPDKGYHGENPKYKIECECRKPKPGMIMKAAADFCVEPRSSYMVGDSTRDILAGKNAGCETILVRTGFAGKDGKYKAKPDHVCDDLLSAAKLIIKAHKAR